CAAPAALPGLQVESFAKLIGGFDGAGIGGRIRVADRVTLLVPSALSEHTSQLGFARVSRLPIGLAFASLSLFLHYRHPGAVHLHIQDRNRLDGQIQLDGSLNLALLVFRNIATDGFGRCARPPWW